MTRKNNLLTGLKSSVYHKIKHFLVFWVKLLSLEEIGKKGGLVFASYVNENISNISTWQNDCSSNGLDAINISLLY